MRNIFVIICNHFCTLLLKPKVQELVNGQQQSVTPCSYMYKTKTISFFSSIKKQTFSLSQCYFREDMYKRNPLMTISFEPKQKNLFCSLTCKKYKRITFLLSKQTEVLFKTHFTWYIP